MKILQGRLKASYLAYAILKHVSANQQTIVELLAFFKGIMPKNKDKNRDNDKKQEGFAGSKQASANVG